jgi:hypothetical protein
MARPVPAGRALAKAVGSSAAESGAAATARGNRAAEFMNTTVETACCLI